MSEGQTPADVVREHLRGFLGPVIEERDGLLRRQAELETELASVREGVRVANSVIDRIEGKHYHKTKPGPKRSEAGHIKTSPEKVAAVREWLDAYGDDLPEDWAASDIYAAMRAQGNGNGVPGKIDVIRRAIQELHETGYLTATKKIRGGGNAYALTRNVGVASE